MQKSIGYRYERYKDYTSAIKCFVQGLSLCEQAPSVPEESKAIVSRAILKFCGDLGDAYSTNGDEEQAKVYFARELTMLRQAAESGVLPDQNDLNFPFPVELNDKQRMAYLSDRLEDYQSAQSLYEQDIEEQRAKLNADPTNPEHMASLLYALDSLRHLSIKEDRIHETQEILSEQRELLQKLTTAYFADPPAKEPTIFDSFRLGHLCENFGDYENARRFMESALAYSRAQAEARPHDSDCQETLAGCLEDLANLHDNLKEYPTADRYFDQAMEIREKQGTEDKSRRRRSGQLSSRLSGIVSEILKAQREAKKITTEE